MLHCSAVSDSPHREALFSGRFLKGHLAVCSALRAENISSRIGVFHFRDEDEFVVLLNADEERIESACAGNVNANHVLRFRFVRSLIHAPDRWPSFVHRTEPFVHNALQAEFAEGRDKTYPAQLELTAKDREAFRGRSGFADLSK